MVKEELYYSYKKDSFKTGEYSIYKVIVKNDLEITSVIYLFGVSKKYEARDITAFLNGSGMTKYQKPYMKRSK